MHQVFRRYWLWIVAWCALVFLGSALLARNEFNRLREEFETSARIAHRLLSQRVVQHDAILATLALLQPASDGSRPEQSLTSVYPQILGVNRREPRGTWFDQRLLPAETLSRALHRPALAAVDLAKGRYALVLASEPVSYALQIDLRASVPWSEWPMAADRSPVRVTLEHEGESFMIQPGQLRAGGWPIEFHKPLAAESQPFEVVAIRRVGVADLPWRWMLAYAAVVSAVLAALVGLQRQRAGRRRAEELLRLGQVARLNTLGELAAGLAHELNQPLTAVLANTQAASRLLADDPPDLDIARRAMAQAVQQARRASEVVTRLRRAVERPDSTAQLQAVDLQDAVRNALYLLEPEFNRRGAVASMESLTTPPVVLAEPVALEQIIHNLLMNALQALEQVPKAERKLKISLVQEGDRGLLTVVDNGPGISSDVLPRIFEPFYTSRDGGLGLGLSLCETLSASMGGSISARNNTPRGSVFTLDLPLA
jgi:C4-dicarboxylate-specific signal transduction histidine kinase